MNWIRREKRLAIYLRDGRRCVYCGATVDDGERLTLDHITPYIAGGSNEPDNLITACCSCNSERCLTPLEAFASRRVQRRIQRLVESPIDTLEAKLLMREFGWQRALQPDTRRK